MVYYTVHRIAVRSHCLFLKPSDCVVQECLSHVLQDFVVCSIESSDIAQFIVVKNIDTLDQ